jgi:short subunit dehydrogenase-like uncharacterized protein
MAHWLLYGANGYTGRLAAERAVERGLRPILAGRNASALARLGTELGLEHRVFGLDDPARLREGLKGMTAVLHCAGPFVHTAPPMVQACLESHTHYLDITGEIVVFETLHQQDSQARAAGVMLLPGAGFDVVPSDCLALYLKQQLPSATHLRLAFRTPFVSGGTLATALEHLGQAPLIRRDGRLVPAPPGLSCTVDFGSGLVRAMPLSWGDLVTAYHSTGIPNLEVYTAFGGRWMGLSGLLEKFLRLPGVKPWLQSRIRRMGGPDAARRAQATSQVWGEARDESGSRRAARLQAPEAYTLTALTAVAAVERVLRGEAPPGFQTPATAYGADFILEIPGVVRTDL